ncbi:tetratricopeptide (TPR) repeat protein [Paraburkholderia sp. JPY465]|uniref:tetratricopeptide repeat protein n=1 Tax=Paraburkholderia sp. JPY465 TaxID=3042285 RepID=UPI003D1CC96A
MTTICRSFQRVATAAVLGVVLALAGPSAHADDRLRPEVAKPLNDAQSQYRAHNYRGALEKIAQAAAVPGKTPHETRIVEEMQGAAAMAAGDTGTAAQAYEALLSSGQLDVAGQQRFAAALAGIYFGQKNYPATIRTVQRYAKAGGDASVRELLLQSYYLAGDCANVVATLKPAVDAALKAGRAAAETQLQMLAECAQKVNDGGARAASLAALVAYYPNPAYEARLFGEVRRRPGYLASLDLDVYRLRRATGTLTTADQYMEMTQLALVAGLPAEAKQVIDQGFASGVLGRGEQAARQKRLQVLVIRRLQGQQDGGRAPVDPLDGALDLVFAGRSQQGIEAMKAGVANGTPHPDAARLRLGEAYYYAGQKERAIQVFRTVKGTDGSAELASLWALIAGR